MGGPSVPAVWYLILYPLQLQNLGEQHVDAALTGTDCWSKNEPLSLAGRKPASQQSQFLLKASGEKQCLECRSSRAHEQQRTCPPLCSWSLCRPLTSAARQEKRLNTERQLPSAVSGHLPLCSALSDSALHNSRTSQLRTSQLRTSVPVKLLPRGSGAREVEALLPATGLSCGRHAQPLPSQTLSPAVKLMSADGALLHSDSLCCTLLHSDALCCTLFTEERRSGACLDPAVP